MTIPRTTSFATPGFTFTTANATGSSASAVRSDASLLLYDATLPDAITFSQSGSAGSAATAARRDHAHAMAADPATNLVQNLENFITGGATQTLYVMGGATEHDPATNEFTGLGLNWSIGTGGAITGDAVLGGAWLLTTGSATNEVHIESAAHLSADEDFTIVGRMEVPNEASRSVLFGLTAGNDPNLGTNDMIAWTVDGTGNYIFKTDSGGTETTRDTGTAATDGAEHSFRIEISGGGGTVKAFFDNSQVGANITTNIPSSSTMRLLAGVKNASASPGRTLKLIDVVAWRDKS